MRNIIDGVTTNLAHSCIVKWYDGIDAHQILTNTMVKTLWTPKTLDFMVALIP